MKETIGFMVSGIILIVIGIILISIGFAMSAESCDQRTVGFESHKYGIFSGCMVKHNGRWLPLDNIRGFDDKG